MADQVLSPAGAKAIQDLAKSIQDSGRKGGGFLDQLTGGGRGNGGSSEDRRHVDTGGADNEEMKNNAATLELFNNAASQSTSRFKKMVAGMAGVSKGYKAGMEQNTSLFQQTIGTLTNDTSNMLNFTVQSMEDFEKAKQVASDETQTAFAELHREYKAGKIEYSEAAAKTKELGINVEWLNMELEDTVPAVVALKSAVKDAAIAHEQGMAQAVIDRSNQSLLGRAFSNLVAHARGVGAVLKGISKVGMIFTALVSVVKLAISAVKELAKATRELITKSLESGMRISADIAATSARMLMTPGEVMKHMAEFRQTMEAGGMSMEQWNAGMQVSSDRMQHFGMTAQEGAKFFSKTAGTFAAVAGQNLKDGAKDFDNFRSMQEDMYLRVKQSIGMTSDEFNNMTGTLAKNEGVQQELLKLDKKDRIGRFQQLQQTALSLKAQGMSIEAATEFANKLSAMAGGDTKSRLKQAAKTQAVFGAAGLGDLGAQVAAEIRKGSRGDKDVIAAGMKTFREATGEMQQSSDLGQQMYGDQLVEKLGMPEIMKDVEKAIAASGNHVANAVKELDRSQNETQTTSKEGEAFVEANKMLQRGEFYAANWKQLEAQAKMANAFSEGAIGTTSKLVTDLTESARTAVTVAGAAFEKLTGLEPTVANAIVKNSETKAGRTAINGDTNGQSLVQLEKRLDMLANLKKKQDQYASNGFPKSERAQAQQEAAKEALASSMAEVAAQLKSLNEQTKANGTVTEKEATAAALHRAETLELEKTKVNQGYTSIRQGRLGG